MATRNLTKKYIELRNAAKANRHLGVKDELHHDESGLLGQGVADSSNYKAARQSLPPAWVERIECVEEDVSKIKLKIGELTSLHTKRLMVNFETDETEQEREIELKTREITEVFHHAEGLLKKFSKLSDDPSLSAPEKQVRKNMQMSMARKLQALSMSFRTTQKQYMEKLQAQKSGTTAFDIISTEQKKGVNVEALDQGFTAIQMQELENVESLVEQRDEEITQIAKSIEELAQIFKELAVLVIDQGTILDRIDYNMENAVENVKAGITHLEKAEESQKNAMSVKCILLLIVLIIIMVGILAWKHS